MRKSKNGNFMFPKKELKVYAGNVDAEQKAVPLFLKVSYFSLIEALDETYGCMNWKKETRIEYIPVGNGVAKKCNTTLSVYSDKHGQWISKDGVGSPSPWAEVNEDKVMESDSLHRAAFGFGIGKNLRTDIPILFPADKCNIVSTQFDAQNIEKTYDTFICEQIVYDEESGKIAAISIINATTKKRVVFKDLIEVEKEKETLVKNLDDLNRQKKEIDYSQIIVTDDNLKDSVFYGKSIAELTEAERIVVYNATSDNELKAKLHELIR